MRASLTVLSLFLLLSGCISVDMDYTPNRPVQNHPVESMMRYPVFYSVAFEKSAVDIEFSPSESEIRKKTEQALRSTGLFSEIRYAPEKGSNTYHVAFHYRLEQSELDSDNMMLGISAATLFLIPGSIDVSLDASAKIFYKGQAIFSTGSTEIHRRYFWLPLLPAGIFMNSAKVFDETTDGVINSLVNDVGAEHQRRYLVSRP